MAESQPDAEGAATAPEAPATGSKDDLPLEYMLAVMNDEKADKARRDRMAIAAAPFLHAKAGEAGKKTERAKAAAVAGKGKFAPAAPPRLVVNNK